MKNLKILIVMAALISMTGCSKHHTKAIDFQTSSNSSPIVQKLHEHYSRWEGVRYKEGGITKDGIDCSGYVFLTYKNKFNKKYPAQQHCYPDTEGKYNPARLSQEILFSLKRDGKHGM